MRYHTQMADRHPYIAPAAPRHRGHATSIGSPPTAARTVRAAVVLALCWGLLALLAPAARADVFGPDESIAQAGGPLQPGTTYSGAFSSPDDIDYLAFDVAQANETLHFDIVNTLTSCNNIDDNYCPMWGTLVDGNGQQLGGEGSAAGTGEVDYASSDGIDWTFPSPGRYYLALDSSGDLPTFQLDFNMVTAASGGGTTGGSGHGHGHGQGGKGGSGTGLAPGATPGTGARPGALISSITIARHQRGRQPSALVVLTQPLAQLDVQVLARTGRGARLSVVGHLLRRRPIAGPERIRVAVRGGAWLARSHAVPVLLRLKALSLDGRTQVVQRHFTLRR
jgi:hypothetical protein